VASDDLAAFLRARLVEDERAATHAHGTVPIHSPDDGHGHARSRRLDEHTRDMYCVWFRPARMLADIAAKRRIVERCQHDLRSYAGTGADAATAYLVLRLLALPYASHHHYRKEWKP
jgi:hypothetical protein